MRGLLEGGGAYLEVHDFCFDFATRTCLSRAVGMVCVRERTTTTVVSR